eukprot:Platyproteum_vivax@DN168_c0_g1_i1.p1
MLTTLAGFLHRNSTASSGKGSERSVPSNKFLRRKNSRRSTMPDVMETANLSVSQTLSDFDTMSISNISTENSKYRIFDDSQILPVSKFAVIQKIQNRIDVWVENTLDQLADVHDTMLERHLALANEDIASVLSIVEQNTPAVFPTIGSIFDSPRLPPVSLSDYFQRLLKNASIGVHSSVIVFALLSKVFENNPQMAFTSWNGHRLLLTAAMMTQKVYHDRFYANEYWAKIGGVTVSNMNRLELTFLRLCDWKLHVTAEEYLRCYWFVRRFIMDSESVRNKQRYANIIVPPWNTVERATINIAIDIERIPFGWLNTFHPKEPKEHNCLNCTPSTDPGNSPPQLNTESGSSTVWGQGQSRSSSLCSAPPGSAVVRP